MVWVWYVKIMEVINNYFIVVGFTSMILTGLVELPTQMLAFGFNFQKEVFIKLPFLVITH